MDDQAFRSWRFVNIVREDALGNYCFESMVVLQLPCQILFLCATKAWRNLAAPALRTTRSKRVMEFLNSRFPQDLGEMTSSAQLGLSLNYGFLNYTKISAAQLQSSSVVSPCNSMRLLAAVACVKIHLADGTLSWLLKKS